MPAPLLRSLADAPATVLVLIPALPEGSKAFVVVGEGEHQGESFAVGDVIVCAGEAPANEATVLCAVGHGRPRLGAWIGGRLVGDAGELCHPARWQLAGRWIATWRLGTQGWSASRLGQVSPVSRPAEPQLELFAA
jgi:hypothetical protein